jgi:hypothetical protein
MSRLWTLLKCKWKWSVYQVGCVYYVMIFTALWSRPKVDKKHIFLCTWLINGVLYYSNLIVNVYLCNVVTRTFQLFTNILIYFVRVNWCDGDVAGLVVYCIINATFLWTGRKWWICIMRYLPSTCDFVFEVLLAVMFGFIPTICN